MAVAGDQGGSIRLPSAACGVVGMKPTHGLVPYTGAYGMVAGFDTLGPVTRGVPENARYLDVMAGKDGLDVRQGGAPAYPVSAAYSTALGNTAEEVYEHVRGLRVGVLQEGFGVGGPDGLADGVDDLVRAAVLKLGDKGAVVEEVSVPLHKDRTAHLDGYCRGATHDDQLHVRRSGDGYAGPPLRLVPDAGGIAGYANPRRDELFVSHQQAVHYAGVHRTSQVWRSLRR